MYAEFYSVLSHNRSTKLNEGKEITSRDLSDETT